MQSTPELSENQDCTRVLAQPDIQVESETPHTWPPPKLAEHSPDHSRSRASASIISTAVGITFSLSPSLLSCFCCASVAQRRSCFSHAMRLGTVRGCCFFPDSPSLWRRYRLYCEGARQSLEKKHFQRLLHSCFGYMFLISVRVLYI